MKQVRGSVLVLILLMLSLILLFSLGLYRQSLGNYQLIANHQDIVRSELQFLQFLNEIKLEKLEKQCQLIEYYFSKNEQFRLKQLGCYQSFRHSIFFYAIREQFFQVENQHHLIYEKVDFINQTFAHTIWQLIYQKDMDTGEAKLISVRILE